MLRKCVLLLSIYFVQEKDKLELANDHTHYVTTKSALLVIKVVIHYIKEYVSLMNILNICMGKVFNYSSKC